MKVMHKRQYNSLRFLFLPRSIFSNQRRRKYFYTRSFLGNGLAMHRVELATSWYVKYVGLCFDNL